MKTQLFFGFLLTLILSLNVDAIAGYNFEPNDQDIFTDYPWLNDIVSPNDCINGETVQVYTEGIYSFVFYKGTMYFQDGTYYCADADNFSCIEAYGLTNLSGTWTCDGDNPPPPVESNLFYTYPWIGSYVSENDCTDGDEVIEYTTGVYSFLYINGTLYFQDGTYYCMDSDNGFSCVDAYGLTMVVDSWICGETNPDSDPIVDEGVFETYPWLTSIVKPTECVDGDFVTEFDVNGYSFVYVFDVDNVNSTSEMTLGQLYFQDGTLYCSDASNYLCLNAYGLLPPQIDQTWSCDDGDGSTNPEPPTDGDCMITNEDYSDVLDLYSDLPGGQSLDIWEVLYEGDSYYYAYTWDCPTPNAPFPTNLTGAVYDCKGNLFCVTPNDNPNYPNCSDFFGISISANTILYELECEDNPLPISDDIFEVYTWLNDNVNIAGCDVGDFIKEYVDGETSYVYIYNAIAPNGGTHGPFYGSLYNSDGDFLCLDEINDSGSCLADYNLSDSQIGLTWSCEDNVNASDDEDNLFPDCGINPQNQAELDAFIETIPVPPGKYAYVFFAEAEGAQYYKVLMYNCDDYINPLDACVNSTGAASLTYDCDGNLVCSGISQCYGEDEVDCDDYFENPHFAGVVVGEVECEENPFIPSLEFFPWLAETIDENDCTANVSATYYTNGNYGFILIADGTGNGNLYYFDGTFYCNTVQNSNCLSNYTSGLTSSVFWTCGVDKTDNERHIEQKESKLHIYPNPSTGKFFVELEQVFDNNQFVSVYDATGRQIKEVQINAFESNIAIDISDHPNGLYFVELKSDLTSKLLRLVKN